MYEVIKKICDERNISIRQLECDTGLGNGAIAKWKKSSPKLSNIIAVAKYLGVTVNDLIDKAPAESDGR